MSNPAHTPKQVKLKSVPKKPATILEMPVSIGRLPKEEQDEAKTMWNRGKIFEFLEEVGNEDGISQSFLIMKTNSGEYRWSGVLVENDQEAMNIMDDIKFRIQYVALMKEIGASDEG